MSIHGYVLRTSFLYQRQVAGMKLTTKFILKNDTIVWEGFPPFPKISGQVYV